MSDLDPESTSGDIDLECTLEDVVVAEWTE